MTDRPVLRCGVVGARRSRHGTGPFLARFLEAAGCEVVGVSGRSPDSARIAAGDLAERFGHPVAAHESVDALLADDLDALVVASPDEFHLEALRAALGARTHVYCEKPLVPAEEHATVGPLVEGFRRCGILVLEGCQWPLLLPAFDELFPDRAEHPSRIAMRLSPAEPGETMLRTSLSHFLSVIQASVSVDANTAVTDLRFEGSCAPDDGLVTTFHLHDGAQEAVCRLELAVCPVQPRPAWIEFDGRRAERQVDLSTYAISLTAGDRRVTVDDPTRALVYRFADLVRSPSLERYRTESHRVEQRARIYHRVVRGLVEHLAG